MLFRRARPLAVLVPLISICATAEAQPADPEPGGKPKPAEGEEGWSALKPTAENAPEERAPEQQEEEPSGTAASPYRSTIEEQQRIEEVDGSDDDDGYSESVAWMKNWVPRYADSRAGIEYDVLLDDPTAMSWDLAARIAFGEEATFAFDLGLPWAWADGGEAIIGNPVVGLLGGGKPADWVGMYGGAWIGIPTKPGFPGDADAAATASQALGTAFLRAGIQSHRFLPILVPLRFGVGAEFQLHPLVYLRTELAPQLNIPTEGGGGNMTLDHITDIEVLSPIGLGGGIRLQEYFTLVDTPLYGGSDRAQVALEPFIAYEPPRQGDYAVPIYARLGLLFALDDPFGFGFESGKIATLRTAVGARF